VSETLRQVVALIRAGRVLVSAHGYDEMSEDGIFAAEAIEGAATAVVVEDHPEYATGPRTLVLQRDRSGRPIHVVWGIPRGQTAPAVLVTAYGPILAAGPRTFCGGALMSNRRHTKLAREGAYAAEVEVELIDAEGGWALTPLLPTPIVSIRCERPYDEAMSRRHGASDASSALHRCRHEHRRTSAFSGRGRAAPDPERSTGDATAAHDQISHLQRLMTWPLDCLRLISTAT